MSEHDVDYYVQELLKLGTSRASPGRQMRIRPPVRTRGEPSAAGPQPEPEATSRRVPDLSRPAPERGAVRTRGGSPGPGLEGLYNEPVEKRLEIVSRLLIEHDKAEQGLLALVDSPGDPDDRVRWDLLKRIERETSSVATQLRSVLALNDPDELIRAEAVLQLSEQAQECAQAGRTAILGGIRETLERVAAEDGSAYVAGEATNGLKILKQA